MTETAPEKTIDLDNGLTLTIRDLSRKISLDAYCVTMEATIAVDVEPGLFSDDDLSRVPFSEIRQRVGGQVFFEHKSERNFIMAPDKETVFQQLVDTFSNNLLGYLNHGDFARKLVLKTYRDNCSNAMPAWK